MRTPVFVLLLAFALGCSSPEDHVYHPPAKDASQPGTNAAASGSKQVGPHAFVVEIRQMKFEPAEVFIHKGDTVVWVNHDLVTHCITEEKTKAWTSAQLPADSVWKKPFSESADYYCAIHQVMKGKITVE